ncbi:hypothetical protein [Nocardia abscessus]|uniref:hypothetical protein n=1 Tax=Nocardia abscessus TaxID=120957 RepID=UPI002458D48D|nr:hypothetical protein [Nocardia abscessus]
MAKSVLTDARFSSRKELLLHPTIDYSRFEVPPPPGEFLVMDEPQHGRYRKPLAGKLTARRMRLLTERVEQITVDHLDAMKKAGPPTDLVAAFARPIPAVMICELLGVPYQDRDSFQENVKSFMSGETSDEDPGQADAVWMGQPLMTAVQRHRTGTGPRLRLPIGMVVQVIIDRMCSARRSRRSPCSADLDNSRG